MSLHKNDSRAQLIQRGRYVWIRWHQYNDACRQIYTCTDTSFAAQGDVYRYGQRGIWATNRYSYKTGAWDRCIHTPANNLALTHIVMTNPKKNGNQRERILRYMQQRPNKAIACNIFAVNLKIMRYWARLRELVQEWHPIINKITYKKHQKLSSRVFTTNTNNRWEKQAK